MHRAPLGPQERAALRTLARQLKRSDPHLARMLSRRGSTILPPLRLTSLPTTAYAVIAAVLLLAGMVLGVASAFWWGLFTVGLAVLRHKARPPHPPPAPGQGTGRTPWRRAGPTG